MTVAKYLRVASDVHLDMSYIGKVKAGMLEWNMMWKPVPMSTDKETVYVIAGDLWQGTKAFDVRYGDQTPWIANVAKQFHTVLFVAGNHDYWGENLKTYDTVLKQRVSELGLDNVFVLQDDELVIGDTKFLGGTLWTDFKHSNPMIMHIVQNGMNDYRYTRCGGAAHMRAEDVLAVHRETKHFFLDRTRRDHPNQKVVVIAHHLPSFQSVPERYRNRQNADLNYGYFSDLDTYMYDPDWQCDLFIHGHTHDNMDYMINNTRVLCNPRGYGAVAQNQEFDETLRLELTEL